MEILVKTKCESCNGYGYITYESWFCDDCKGKGFIITSLINPSEKIETEKSSSKNIILRLHGLIAEIEEMESYEHDSLIDRNDLLKKIKRMFPELEK